MIIINDIQVVIAAALVPVQLLIFIHAFREIVPTPCENFSAQRRERRDSLGASTLIALDAGAKNFLIRLAESLMVITMSHDEGHVDLRVYLPAFFPRAIARKHESAVTLANRHVESYLHPRDEMYTLLSDGIHVYRATFVVE